jgi:diguanylate cyclase (GGDEF)-like protein
MTEQTTLAARLLGQRSAPAVTIAMIVLAMSACVVGLVTWKAVEARNTALAQREIGIPDLAHSLAEQASHAIQSVDVALTDMADLLQYQSPNPERTNQHLQDVVAALPQIRDIAMFDAGGACIYTSTSEARCANSSAQRYFGYHRETDSRDLRISGSLPPGAAGQPIITLSKRLNKDGRFAGVMSATINNDRFSDLYKSFELGAKGGISVLRPDGLVLIQSSSGQTGARTIAIDPPRITLNGPLTGYRKVVSVDGETRYFAYAQAPRYPFIIAVGQQEDDILAGWRAGLWSDVTVAALLLASVILLAALLASQLRIRLRMEQVLRERETELNAVNSRLAELATTDGLTGLANRRTLDGFLRLEYQARSEISLLLLDIDNFKAFNDTLGHQAGDECLKRVARVLADATAGSGGLAARYGGEEFAIILPGMSEQSAIAIAEAVRLQVRALDIVNAASEHGYLTVSIGIAGKTATTANEAELLRAADLALYAGKRRGRNCSVATSSLADEAGIVPNDPSFEADRAPMRGLFTERPAEPA